jgi:hypothetical protein
MHAAPTCASQASCRSNQHAAHMRCAAVVPQQLQRQTSLLTVSEQTVNLRVAAAQVWALPL